MMKRLFILGMSGLFTFCNNPTAVQSETVSYTKEQEVIYIPTNSPWRSHLQTAPVVEGWHHFEHTSTAVVKTIPTQYAEITSPFSGRVVRSFVTLGQKVAVNTPLYELSSTDYFDAQKEYLNAKQEYHLAESQFQREQDLFKHGVGVRQELDQAQTAFEMAKLSFKNTEQALKLFGMAAGQVQLGTPLVVRAPISGEVIENHIVIGQYLAEDADPLVKVANLSKVWIVARVKEKDVHHLANYEKVEVQNQSDVGSPIAGTLVHINELIDEESRSVEVFIEVDNSNRYWRPGMFTSIRFIDKAVEVITAPVKAIMQSETTEFVFVKVGEDAYQQRAVQTAGIKENRVLVVAGLQASDEVVSEGGIYLLKAL